MPLCTACATLIRIAGMTLLSNHGRTWSCPVSEVVPHVQRAAAASHRLICNAQRATGERAAAFRRTVDLCQHRLTELKDYVDSIFQAVMAHRFR